MGGTDYENGGYGTSRREGCIDASLGVYNLPVIGKFIYENCPSGCVILRTTRYTVPGPPVLASPSLPDVWGLKVSVRDSCC